MKITIVKVGGKVVEEPESLNALLNDFANIVGAKILVHGGGRSATKLSERLGIETKMVDGRRITDRETLDVVTMVYAGLVNKTIVAELQKRNINAIGLCGADLDLIHSVKRPLKNGIDYGYVGDVKRVETGVLASLIEQGAIPVVSPITHDGNGQLLNTNADTIASELARALACSEDLEVNLIYCFEKPGVLMDAEDDSTVISSMTYAEFQEYKETGVVAAGMIPKLDNGFDAIRIGVKSVMITNTDGLKTGRGTVLLKE
ncbi:MAG: acetylglutamate kinase [Bacteroidia bacterium]|nr:acetylglutamate kinase [Bacteroidia bacterium]